LVTSPESEALHARGQRRDWSELPFPIVSEIEEFLGGTIAEATTMHGGFSPGIAARVVTSSGRRVFVKAVSSEINRDAATFHKREIRIARSLNDVTDVPVPRLLWWYDDQDAPWVVLVFEDINGHQPTQPWIPAELDQVVVALNLLSDQLSPSPLGPPAVGLAQDEGDLSRNFWRHLAEQTPDTLDAWSLRHLDQLAVIGEQTAGAVQGSTLLHMDLRADNLLVDASGKVFVVDWPHARIGAAWLDPMFMAPSVEMHGGPGADVFFERFDFANDADFEAVSVGLVWMAGFFTGKSLEPEIPALPGLRAFQAAQGAVSRRWLAKRFGWD
jgi:serine/threonine protein kinase